MFLLGNVCYFVLHFELSDAHLCACFVNMFCERTYLSLFPGQKKEQEEFCHRVQLYSLDIFEWYTDS